jgi:hypothetical protein
VAEQPWAKVVPSPLAQEGELWLRGTSDAPLVLCHTSDTDLGHWLASGSDLTFDAWLARQEQQTP